MRHAKAHAAGVEVDGAQDLGMRVIGVDNRRATRGDLSKQLGLGPAILQRDLGGQAVGHADVRHHCGLERDSLEAAGLDAWPETSITPAAQF